MLKESEDRFRREMSIDVQQVNIQMSRQFAQDLSHAIRKALTLENISNSSGKFDDVSKLTLIELMERLMKVERISVYTTTEREELAKQVNSHFG